MGGCPPLAEPVQAVLHLRGILKFSGLSTYPLLA